MAKNPHSCAAWPSSWDSRNGDGNSASVVKNASLKAFTVLTPVKDVLRVRGHGSILVLI